MRIHIAGALMIASSLSSMQPNIKIYKDKNIIFATHNTSKISLRHELDFYIYLIKYSSHAPNKWIEIYLGHHPKTRDNLVESRIIDKKWGSTKISKYSSDDKFYFVLEVVNDDFLPKLEFSFLKQENMDIELQALINSVDFSKRILKQAEKEKAVMATSPTLPATRD